MTNEEIDAITKMLDKKASEIMELCDSVRIVVTVRDRDNNETRAFSSGAGNYYAQRGSIQVWMESHNNSSDR